ncbi:MAG TPA: c-type cytochrome [Anaerolineales bacterium]|nr:c-type cytochrome [Anaerolineales bacterium]
MRSFISCLPLVLLLASCGGGESDSSPSPGPVAGTDASAPEVVDTAPPVQDTNEVADSAAAGEVLFKKMTIGSTPGCVTCHSLQPGVRLVGPSLADAATVAASAVEGMSAEDFLRQSIVEPNAHVTEGFMPGLMFQNYGETLSEQQINDLVAFLLTQE